MAAQHTNGIFQALHCVFVLPALRPAFPTRLLPPSSLSRRQLLPARRAFSNTPTRLTKSRPPEERHQKWNEEIKARVIYLIDNETNKLIPEVRTRYDILRDLNTDTHRLVQLSPDEPDNPDFIPACKIVSKKDSYEAQRRRRALAKENKKTRTVADSTKTLELNWAIDGNDLGHRLDRVREFLGEGRKVEIVLAAKKKGRRATGQECQALLKRLRGVVEEVQGAREAKPLDGKIGGFATMVLQGKISAAHAQMQASGEGVTQQAASGG